MALRMSSASSRHRAAADPSSRPGGSGGVVGGTSRCRSVQRGVGHPSARTPSSRSGQRHGASERGRGCTCAPSRRWRRYDSRSSCTPDASAQPNRYDRAGPKRHRSRAVPPLAADSIGRPTASISCMATAPASLPEVARSASAPRRRTKRPMHRQQDHRPHRVSSTGDGRPVAAAMRSGLMWRPAVEHISDAATIEKYEHDARGRSPTAVGRRAYLQLPRASLVRPDRTPSAEGTIIRAGSCDPCCGARPPEVGGTDASRAGNDAWREPARRRMPPRTQRGWSASRAARSRSTSAAHATQRRSERRQPTEPSICSSIRRLHSTAYSIGRVRVIGSMKPLTTMPIACSCDRPRLIR